MSDNNSQWYYQAYMHIFHIIHYNFYPEDIVHIFPMNSDIKIKASVEELTPLPSFWIILSELIFLSKNWKFITK